MKILYIECNMGAAGDMLMAALLELVDEPERFINKLNGLGLPGVEVRRVPDRKHGIAGTRVEVTVGGESELSEDSDITKLHDHTHSHGNDHAHEHDHLKEVGGDVGKICDLIGHLPLMENVKKNAIQVYSLLAEAESSVHGVPASEIHLHELGTMDAICDIAGVCMLMDELSPDIVIASPVHVGSGFVRISHGIVPVPAPATAELLCGVPMYGGDIKGELCTPTGAALLRHFTGSFGNMPLMTVSRIGCGMGTKDFDAVNCVRMFYGETHSDSKANGEIAVLECNLDDMTGEAIGFAAEQLLEAGALDVFTIPVQMKKSRPGVQLTCICLPGDSDYYAALILKYTTTFGVRKHICARYELKREIGVIAAEYGDIRMKRGYGYGVEKSKPEYEDIANAARVSGVSLSHITKTIYGREGEQAAE